MGGGGVETEKLAKYIDERIKTWSNISSLSKTVFSTDRTLIRGEEGPKCLAAPPTPYMAQAIFSLPVAVDTLGGYN